MDPFAHTERKRNRQADRQKDKRRNKRNVGVVNGVKSKLIAKIDR